MVIELLPEQHERLRPLFASYDARLHGCVEAVFSGEFGRAWADDVDAPTVGMAELDFWFLAGDAGSADVPALLRMIAPRRTIVTDGSAAWDAAVWKNFGPNLSERTRRALTTPRPQEWDRDALRAMAASLPEGFSIRRVGAADVERFVAIEPFLTANFRTYERFLERGVGFGVWEGDACVAGASSYTLANGKLEVEIDTAPEYRRRGLARAVAATLILHCLDEGIEPCWDAHNPESAALAVQLGFVDPQPYTVFVVDA